MLEGTCSHWKSMKTIAIIATTLLFLFGFCAVFKAQDGPALDNTQILEQSQEALNQQDYARALGLLKDGLLRFPDDENLRLQLARTYVYQTNDGQAIAILNSILRKNPASRRAKLQLAQVLGYRKTYRQSDGLYLELLRADPGDEAASLGLIHNLILEGKKAQAQAEAHRALALHPTSLSLQQYSDYMAKDPPVEALRPRSNLVQASESYFADTSGNRTFYSSQGVGYQPGKNVSARLRMEETSLWKTGSSKEAVFSGTEETRVRITRFLALRAGAGGVSFPDTGNRVLYSGDLEIYPYKSLLVSGGFSRFPVVPTFDSLQFDLLSEGWHSRVDYRTRDFFLAGNFALSHYSDGNRAEREGAETLRWFGPHEGQFDFGLAVGYAFRHLHFSQDLNHGYFSPIQYRSHLGATGFRVRIGKVYRGEYLGYGGFELRGNLIGYSLAGELRMKNDFSFGRWNLAADYSYFHLAQATGAFHANAVTATLGYGF
jgi:tetratricopeptide (TPR) repeat protein